VTRPAGTTPNGLPYPGSVDIHARTPAALQSLAEAIESKLTAVTPGIILDPWRGIVNLPSFGGSYSTFTIPFPRLAAVNGWVGVYGVDDGGGLQDGFVTCVPGAGGNGYFTVAPWTRVKPTTAITVHAVGWGPPR